MIHYRGETPIVYNDTRMDEGAAEELHYLVAQLEDSILPDVLGLPDLHSLWTTCRLEESSSVLAGFD